MLGRFVGDLGALMKDISEGDIVYVRQAGLEEDIPPKRKVGKASPAKAKPKAKSPSKKGKEKSNGQ
jgi:uridine phosphorylase